jgi:hypothetical protein
MGGWSMVGPADSFCFNPCGLIPVSHPWALFISIPLWGMLQIIGCPLRGLPILIPFGKTSNHWLAFRVISEIIPAGLFFISDPQALLILIPLRGMLQIIGCPLRGLPILIPFGKTSLWLREQDLNLQPSGYEPDELPTAPSRVRLISCSIITPLRGSVKQTSGKWANSSFLISEHIIEKSY